MKHRPRPTEQDDLLRPRLVDMIDPRHELVKLSALIDWEVFEREWSGFFPSGKGRPATEPRLVAGLLWMLYKTPPGLAMRAISVDIETTRLMGVKVDRIIALTFAIGSALASRLRLLGRPPARASSARAESTGEGRLEEAAHRVQEP